MKLYVASILLCSEEIQIFLPWYVVGHLTDSKWNDNIDKMVGKCF